MVRGTVALTFQKINSLMYPKINLERLSLGHPARMNYFNFHPLALQTRYFEYLPGRIKFSGFSGHQNIQNSGIPGFRDSNLLPNLQECV